MKGQRVLVVGASAGIGRAFAVQAVGAGADVVLSARRAEALATAVAEAGAGHPVAADICDDDARAALVAAAVDRLGAIDLLFYAAGRADLRLLAETDDAAWHATLDTNVVALNQLLRHALPHLSDTAIVAVLSSEAATMPRSGLAAYAASKAALETALRVWRIEHASIRFSTIAVGATQPTEFGAGFAPELLGPVLEDWSRRGLLQREYMATDEVAAVLVGLYGIALVNPSVGVEYLLLRSPSPLPD